MKTLKTIVIIVVLLATLNACKQQSKGTTEKADNSDDKIQKVEVVKPKQRSFKSEILITGTVYPNQVVTIYSMERGMLKLVRKDIGDKVRRGEIIAVLENPELIQQKRKWQAESKAKKAHYDRLYSVYKKTPALTNIQMVESAEAEYLSTQSYLDAVNDRIGFLTIKTPFSGVITKRYVDKGAMIQSGLSQSNPQALFELQEINPLRLTIPVPESDAVAVQKGMEVRVNLPEFSAKYFRAKVSRTSRVLDPVSKTMQVEIDLDNADGKILSGMYGKVLLQIGSRENILSLPVIAKVSHKNESYVLAVEGGIVKRIPVKLGLSNRDYFEVLNDKVKSETLVIVQGKGLVIPGQMVKPILKQ